MATRKTAPAAKTTRKPRSKSTPAVQNRYDAAGMGRRMLGWMPPNSGPNKAITGLQKIRDRSSDLVRNDWAGSAGIQHWTTTLIGTGIVPRLKRVKAKAKKLAYTDLWSSWGRECDADSVLDFYGMQTLATRSWLERGEVFVRLRPRRINSGMRVPFQIQLLEADYVPLLDADSWPGLPRGNRIRSGIELNDRGQRVAYWCYKHHPGDGQHSLSSLDAGQLIRVAKSQMLHIFEPKRPNQLRGVPDFAAVMAHLRTVSDLNDAVLERQKIANLFAVFLKKMAPAFPQDTNDPLTGQPIKTDSSGSNIVGISPGAMIQLDDGEEAQFANPPEPGTMIHEYLRTVNLWTAAGQNLPYEVLTGDIRNVSDRTLRVVMNEFRRFAEQRQWQVIVPMFCQPVRDYWTDMAVLSGEVSVADADDVKMVEWAPDGWAYIHPVQDVQARQAEVEAGFRSRSSVIGERGDDPDTVDQERADDKQREDDLGLQPEPMEGDGAQGGQQADGDGIAPGEYPRNAYFDRLRAERLQAETRAIEANAGKPSDTTKLVEAFSTLMQQQQVQMQATMQAFSEVLKAFAERPLVTEVKNDVKVEPTPVQITNDVTVEPTPVQITNDVTVEPTPVQITNEVDVPPAEVTVKLPDRRIESDITRKDGDIVKVVQTETTIPPTTH